MKISLDLVNSFVRPVIIFLAVVVLIFLIIAISPKRISGDFDVYYSASQNYLANAPMYIPHGGIEEFKYFPLFALLFSPLTLLGKIPALYVWNLLNIFLFYSIFYLLYKLKQFSFNNIKDLLILIFLFALIGRYVFANIKLGQVNILLCFLMVLTMYLQINKKYFWAAVVLAFSLMIKFFPLLFLAYFILKREFKLVGYTILATTFFLLLPALYSGFELNFRYLHDWFVLLKSGSAAIYYSYKNYSLLSFFSWLFIARHEYNYIYDYRSITSVLTHSVYYAWAVSCAVFFVAYFYDVFFVKDQDERIKYLDFSCLFACGLLFNPLAYLNALVFLTIPYFFILRSLFYSKLKPVQIFTGSFLLLLGFILTMGDNKIFFKDEQVFNMFLEYKPLMWVIILAYVNVWFIKSFLKNKNHCAYGHKGV